MTASKVKMIDVRTKGEWIEKHLPEGDGVELIDFNSPDFQDRIAKLDRDISYELFCRSGVRSGHAAKLMQDMGFKQAKNIGTIEDAARSTGKTCVGTQC